jgi:hypothetical protein
MVNKSESLINIVTPNKPKMLKNSTRNRRLGPKGKRSGVVASNSTTADEAPSVNRRDASPSSTQALTFAGTYAERGKVRHVVVCIAVTLSRERHHLLFCQQYPTGACVTGNGGVRSLRDNIASSNMDGSESASGHCDC